MALTAWVARPSQSAKQSKAKKGSTSARNRAASGARYSLALEVAAVTFVAFAIIDVNWSMLAWSIALAVAVPCWFFFFNGRCGHRRPDRWTLTGMIY
jgi:hypothetical protein